MKIHEFEAIRLFKSRNLIFVVSLLLISLFFVHLGIMEFREFQDRKRIFLEYENKKINSYLNYIQYGVDGLNIMMEPSGLCVFFESKRLPRQIESRIDTSEVINIFTQYKGRLIFHEDGYKDFGGFIFLVGTLYMVYMGAIHFKNHKFMEYILTRKSILKSIASSIFFLDMIFALIFGIVFLYAMVQGIPISESEGILFGEYSLYTIVFLDIFYGIGLITASLFKNEKLLLSTGIWFLLVFLLPEAHNIMLIQKSGTIPSIESLNISKINLLLEQQKNGCLKPDQNGNEKNPAYSIVQERLNKLYDQNQKTEMDFNRMVFQIIRTDEKMSLFTPVFFYEHLTKELSGKGYRSYQDFLYYTYSFRKKFVEFIFAHRYLYHSQKIFPFVKAQENLFKSKIQPPSQYFWGLGMVIFINIALFLSSYFILIHRMKRSKVSKALEEEKIKPGMMTVILCKNEQILDNMFNYYLDKDNYVCLDNVDPDDIDPGTRLKPFFMMLCDNLGANKEVALKNLSMLGFSENDWDKGHNHPDIRKKLYCAVVLAVEKEVLVLKDFFKCETREFESAFRGLLKEKLMNQKKIVYITTDSPQVDTPFLKENMVLRCDQYQELELQDPCVYIFR